VQPHRSSLEEEGPIVLKPKLPTIEPDSVWRRILLHPFCHRHRLYIHL
jgi:hypothetical protein